ncbi:MAG TPA: iron-containing alcohol dehydrogenase [Candidatus Latescibacteria bacterium]|nr:iron-containing alcohol dehydrogenase [Candidatus Latescibacterota bacterium]
MRFDYLMPTRILFGNDSIGEVGQEAHRLGRKALLVTGRSSFRKGGCRDEARGYKGIRRGADAE